MRNIIIGLETIPAKKGREAQVSIFYCGTDGGAFRAAHAKLVKENSTSRFFRVTNPVLTPLQNVVRSNEDHPDVIAANERRAALAKKTDAATQPVLMLDLEAGFTAEGLADKKKDELLGIAEQLIKAGKLTELPKGKKDDIITAILLACPAPEPEQEQPQS